MGKRVRNYKLQITNCKCLGWCCHITRMVPRLTIKPISHSINDLRIASQITKSSGDGGNP
jgi:hypothetical protein